MTAAVDCIADHNQRLIATTVPAIHLLGKYHAFFATMLLSLRDSLVRLASLQASSIIHPQTCCYTHHL